MSDRGRNPVLARVERLLARMGVHKRTIRADGVRYRERSGISLRRALGELGPGVKEYEARFTGAAGERRSMRIRYTRSRRYDDIGSDPRVWLYERFIDRVRPGMRVLELGCGTGAGSAMLARAVGPSGGVVSLDRDGESIRFARQRYPSDQQGFELGWLESLDGELDGAFECMVCVDPLRIAEDDAERARQSVQLVRVARPGAMVVAIHETRDGLEGVVERLTGFGLVERDRIGADPRDGWVGCVLVKPDPQRARGGRGG